MQFLKRRTNEKEFRQVLSAISKQDDEKRSLENNAVQSSKRMMILIKKNCFLEAELFDSCLLCRRDDEKIIILTLEGEMTRDDYCFLCITQ